MPLLQRRGRGRAARAGALIARETVPSLKPRKVMSPPSPATAGRMRVSSRSLIVSTVCASFGAKNSPSSTTSAREPSESSRRARHEMLHDRAQYGRLQMRPLAARFGHRDEIRAEEHAGDAVDAEQALGQRRTLPACSGSGSRRAVAAGRPGRNLSVAGFGVASVWMNMSRSYVSHGTRQPVPQIRMGLHRMGQAAQKVEFPVKGFARLCRSLHVTPAPPPRPRSPPGTIVIGIGSSRRLATANAHTSGPGPSRSAPAAEHQERDVGVRLDQPDDLVGLAPSDDHFRHPAEAFVRGLRRKAEHALALLVCSSMHLADAHPVLVIGRRDDQAEQHRRPPCGRCGSRQKSGAASASALSSTIARNSGGWPVSKDGVGSIDHGACCHAAASASAQRGPRRNVIEARLAILTCNNRLHLSANESNDVLDLVHDRLGDRACTIGAFPSTRSISAGSRRGGASRRRSARSSPPRARRAPS